MKVCRCQNNYHLRLQPRCNQVLAASGPPSWSATSRGFTTQRVGVICLPLSLFGVSLGSLFLDFLLFPGLVFCGCFQPCVCACACAGAGVFVVFRAWAFVVPSAFLRCFCCCGGPIWGRAACVCLSGVLPGSVLRSFLRDLARHIGGRTSPRLVRISFGSPQS